MYTPKTFEENNLETLHQFMEKNNFAVLFSSDGDGIPQATHLPFMVESTVSGYGRLIAHFAKANPHWKTLSPEKEVLVVFQGPHSYISPTWYQPKTSVPTWNYSAVHAYGKAQLIHEESRLRTMVDRLVDFHEGRDNLPGYEENFPHHLIQAIVGIEIIIERIEGKFKFNQNKPIADQQGVIAALSQSEDSVQQAVAAIMEENLNQRRD